MPRIHVASPILRSSSAGTAFPQPAQKPLPMDEWQARHHNRAPLWRRLFGRSAA